MKKYIAFILALVLAFTLALLGCEKKAEAPKAVSEPAAAPAEPVPAPATAAPAPAPAPMPAPKPAKK